MAFIPDEAVDRMTELSSGAWRLYCYLARCRNQRSGKCCPSVAVTMEAIGVNRGSVYALRKELVNEKWARFDGDSAVLLVGFDSLNNQTPIAAVKGLSPAVVALRVADTPSNNGTDHFSLNNQTPNAKNIEDNALSLAESEKSDNQPDSLKNRTGSPNNQTGESEKSEKQSENSDSYIRKNQQIEPAKGTSKGGTPEPPFSSSSDTHVDEMTLGDAILEVLPSLQMNYSAQLQACQLAMNLQATVKDIQRWPRWFQTRYPGAIKNHFKFQDTFADMIRETAEKTAGYWFVFYACGHKDGAELSAKADQEIKREADWLDSQVGDTEKVTWKARGLLPQHFRKYWNDSLKYPGFPSPEKVRTYWTQFTEWVVKQNGSLR